jgi:aquaporin rerated protein, other eukaryote
MFLFMGFAAANIANLPSANPTAANGSTLTSTANLLFIAFAFGISLVINVWIFFRVSGALFNPAIALSLAIARVMPPLRAALLVIAQILGGITAAALVSNLTPGGLNVGNRLGAGVSPVQGHQLHITADDRFIN